MGTSLQYVALLRGINVGGKNIIKMADLKACFEEIGVTCVRTYIQSGNVLFFSDDPDQTRLTALIEAALSQTFRYGSRLVLRNSDEMQKIVASAPSNFGNEPDTYRYDVIFLKEPLQVDEAMQSISVKEGVDQAYAGDGALYFIRLISRASQSRLTRLVSLPIYQQITIRNWNTTTKLLALMSEEYRNL